MISIMVKKVIIIFILIILFISNSSNAFYNYEKNFSIFKLNRNINPVNYNISYSENRFTNKDVEVKIKFDKAVSLLSNNDFNISEDEKTYSKILANNENKRLLFRDEDFNYKEIAYNVDWIDKELPIISGAENRKNLQ